MLGSLVARMINCCVVKAREGGGYSTNVFMGRFRPKVQPLPFCIPFFMKKVPLSYSFY